MRLFGRAVSSSAQTAAGGSVHATKAHTDKTLDQAVEALDDVQGYLGRAHRYDTEALPSNAGHPITQALRSVDELYGMKIPAQLDRDIDAVRTALEGVRLKVRDMDAPAPREPAPSGDRVGAADTAASSARQTIAEVRRHVARIDDARWKTGIAARSARDEALLLDDDVAVLEVREATARAQSEKMARMRELADQIAEHDASTSDHVKTLEDLAHVLPEQTRYAVAGEKAAARHLTRGDRS